MKTTEYLDSEDEYIPWSTSLKCLEYIDLMLSRDHYDLFAVSSMTQYSHFFYKKTANRYFTVNEERNEQDVLNDCAPDIHRLLSR